MNTRDLPAFPLFCGPGDEHNNAGLTKREYFAAMAMQGWITTLGARHGQPGYSDGDAAAEAARRAVHSADVLIELLDEQSGVGEQR